MTKPNFTLTLTGQPVNWGINRFPDGQIQVWVDLEGVFLGQQQVKCECSLFTPEDVHILQQLQFMLGDDLSTEIRYLYGSRCDKNTLGLCNVAEMMMNRLSFRRIWCPHHLHRSHPRVVTPIPKWLFNDIDLIIFPDKSAEGRFAGLIPNSIPTVTCGKVRSADGTITEYTVPDLSSIQGHVLVLDDLCDGGNTFIKLAQSAGIPQQRMGLYTVHGLYTKGTDELFKYYSRVWCSTSCASMPRGDAYTVPDEDMEFK